MSVIKIKILSGELQGEISGFKTREEAFAASSLFTKFGLRCKVEIIPEREKAVPPTPDQHRIATDKHARMNPQQKRTQTNSSSKSTHIEIVMILVRFFESKLNRKLDKAEELSISHTILEYGVNPELIGFAADYYTRRRVKDVDKILSQAIKLKRVGCKTKEDAQKLLLGYRAQY